MSNKCNPRIKPSYPDPVQEGIEPPSMLQPEHMTGQAKEDIEPPFSSGYIKLVQFKGRFEGKIQGKIDAGEWSETALIQPGKKAVSSAILSLGSSKTSAVSTKYLIRRVECPRQIFQIHFHWSNSNQLYRYDVNIFVYNFFKLKIFNKILKRAVNFFSDCVFFS